MVFKFSTFFPEPPISCQQIIFDLIISPKFNSKSSKFYLPQPFSQSTRKTSFIGSVFTSNFHLLNLFFICVWLLPFQHHPESGTHKLISLLPGSLFQLSPGFFQNSFKKTIQGLASVEYYCAAIKSLLNLNILSSVLCKHPHF